MIHAIDADTERLEEERMAYGHAVAAEKERLDNLEAALRTSQFLSEASQFDSQDLIQRYVCFSKDRMYCWRFL